MHIQHLIRAVRLLVIGLAGAAAMTAQAQQSPRIAVTDLSYQETVRQYFQNIEYKEKFNASQSSRERFRDSDYSSSGSASSNSRASGEVSFKSSSGVQTFIDRGELRKFTADIKGELIKMGHRVVQGKPWTANNTEKLYDIIGRIKQGYYAGADYVLWGSINNVDWRRDDNPIQGSNATSHSLSLELVGEFSLINTRTYEVKAAFTAMGAGNDTKLTNAYGTNLTLNRSKVMMEVSRSLGEAVAQEIEAQFGAGASRNSYSSTTVRETRSESNEEKVIIFK